MESVLVETMSQLESKDIFVIAVPEDGDKVGHFQSTIGITTDNYPALWLLDLGWADSKDIMKYKFDRDFDQ